jgi:anti-sigma B factor antagonist
MGTHRFEHFPDPPPARRAVLTHTTAHEDVHRVRIAFSGEIDISSADLLDAAVTDALRSHHLRHIDIDLAGVRFIDSSGVYALMRCRTQAVEAGCQLAVTNPQPMTYRVLKITGMLAALTVRAVPDKPID